MVRGGKEESSGKGTLMDMEPKLVNLILVNRSRVEGAQTLASYVTHQHLRELMLMYTVSNTPIFQLHYIVLIYRGTT